MSQKLGSYYLQNWEEYYLSVSSRPEDIPWDVDPEIAIRLDISLMREYFNHQLPVVDVGCGIGTQTKVLNREFLNVIGTDISEEAIRIAKDKYSGEGLTFSQLDILNFEQVQSFHEGVGDCNIYMRGTLQQILLQDRGQFTDAIKKILGTDGCIYFIELSDEAKNFFFRLRLKLGDFPPQLKRVLSEKVTELVGVSLNDVEEIFPVENFTHLQKGRSTIALKLSAEQYVNVPAVYGVLKANLLADK